MVPSVPRPAMLFETGFWAGTLGVNLYTGESCRSALYCAGVAGVRERSGVRGHGFLPAASAPEFGRRNA